MNCIWDDLFTDTPHEHIRHAKYHMWLYLAYSGVFFRAKTFTLSISPNFNSFSDTNTKNEGKWKNLHLWQKFYTPPREGQISQLGKP